MKAILVIYAGPALELITGLFDQHHVGGYTDLGDARGAGPTGRLLGTRAWPGHARVLLTIVPDERVSGLTDALRIVKTALHPGEHLHVAVLPVDDSF